MLENKFQANQGTLIQLNDFALSEIVLFLESNMVDSLISMNDMVLIDFLP